MRPVILALVVAIICAFAESSVQIAAEIKAIPALPPVIGHFYPPQP